MKVHPALVASAVALAAFPPITSAAPRPIAQIEQVTRADGLFGASPIVEPWASNPQATAVSEDGRIAVFSYSTVHGDLDVGSPILPEGLYARDLALGKTYRISSLNGNLASIDPTGTSVAFYSSEPLDPADTNGANDLYVWNRLSGRSRLVSRADGVGGPALGADSAGALVGNGTTAIFSSGGRVYRRGLLTARTTRIASGAFATTVGSPIDHAEDYASADGRVVSTTAGIVTPWGQWPLGLELADGQTSFANYRTARVSQSGRVAVIQDQGVFDFGALDKLTWIDTRTGARHAVPSLSLPATYGGDVLRVLPDDRRVIVLTWDTSGEELFNRVFTVDLTTGAATELDAPIGNYSRNLRYAVGVSSSRYDRLAPRAFFVYGLGGAQLPGPIEVPAPSAWASLEYLCRPAPDAAADYVGPVVLVPLDLGPVPANSARVRAWNTAGALVTDETLTPDSPDYPNVDPAPGVGIPVGESAFRLELTIRLADGRVSREAQDIPAHAPNCWNYIENQ